MRQPDIDNMPIVKMLKAYSRSRPVRFHMPGHKGAAKFRRFYGKWAGLDITELSFSDNLLSAQSVIADAESLYEVSQSCQKVKLCTCGSTVALLSLLHSIKDRAGRLIVERDSHKSVFAALKICGIEPFFISRDKSGYITPDIIAAALLDCPDAMGLLLTVPDYYGRLTGLKQIAKLLKPQNRLLLLDAAHGAHLNYILPGYYAHADAYVCSAHKTMPALTQGSFVCFNNILLYKNFCRSFNIFHTSSPSYVLLASLDFARAYMDKYGKAAIMRVRAAVTKYAEKIRELGFSARFSVDGLKLIIGAGDVPCAAYNLADYLESCNIYAEFANDDHMLLMLSAADSERQLKLLYRYIVKFKKHHNIISCDRKQHGSIITEPAMPFLQAANSAVKYVKISDAAGEIAAGEAGVYPPATPVIVSGDYISQKACDFLLANTGHLFGVYDGCLAVVAT